MFVHVRYIRYHDEASENLQNALFVEHGTNSTYLHSHTPKINISHVKFCESSCLLLTRFLPASRPESLNCYPCCSIYAVSFFAVPWHFVSGLSKPSISTMVSIHPAYHENIICIYISTVCFASGVAINY